MLTKTAKDEKLYGYETLVHDIFDALEDIGVFDEEVKPDIEYVKQKVDEIFWETKIMCPLCAYIGKGQGLDKSVMDKLVPYLKGEIK